MNAPSNSKADLEARLARVEELINEDPAAAEQAVVAVLQDYPGEPAALLYQGIARRLMRKPEAALEVLTPLCESVPESPMPHLQMGLALRETGDDAGAVAAMRRAVAARGDFADAWLCLADTLLAIGDAEGSQQAFNNYVRAAAGNPVLQQAASALRANRTADAERILRGRLASHPNDISALFMLADIAIRHGMQEDGEKLLRRCVELAPEYEIARHNLALVLMQSNNPASALEHVDRLISDAPDNPAFRSLKAAILSRAMRFDEAIDLYQQLLDEAPAQPAILSSMGHALRTVGRRDEAVAAYRRAMEVAPDYGEAAWSLANLKTAEVSDAEIEAMRAQLANPSLSDINRIHFHFALGRALEDRQDYAESFEHYERGNRAQRSRITYDASELDTHVQQFEQRFDRDFFVQRNGWGQDAADPILVIGLPRAGSTLVEQILASHPQVQGTPELPLLLTAARRYAARHDFPVAMLPAHLDEDASRELGQSYLDLMQVQRTASTPHFVDKMPNNFMHVALIQLILPNARIVDVRRHPMACGFSIYKQFFAQGQPFSYSLEEIGRFYTGYVKLMDYFDTVMPGRVHRVIYESLIDDAEGEVRGLLDYCGLPFDPACLNFHENQRPVNTASSEQVREPLHRGGLEHWRHYEQWLEPLRAAIGPLESTYAGSGDN